MAATAHIMEENKTAIASIERGIAQRIGSERFEMWFDRKTRLSLDGHTLTIGAGNTFVANWIRNKFTDDARAAARIVLACDVDVRVNVAEKNATDQTSDAIAGAESGRRPMISGPKQSLILSPPPSLPRAATMALNPKYTLEEFVVGTSNQLAYHAATQVAAHPGEQFNPLFIHGHCGLGKTHLLQGICRRFTHTHPRKKWLYLTAEQFTNDFLEAIKHHKMDLFRRRIRHTDLLIIDDAHFLANKRATQEEFLHTFNQIDGAGCQVVLASDCPPKQIASLADALVNRFVSGMVLRVDAPDLPTRVDILRRRAARMHWQISDAVLMHIAQSTTASVRELEGLLLQVVAGMNLMQCGGGDPAAIVSEIKDRTAVGRRPVTVERIVQAVGEYFTIPPAAITGASREKIVSTARSIAMHLARRHTGMSYPEIGRAMGNKNHSTVIAACRRVETLRAQGALIRWNGPDGTHHQAMPDALHALEGKLRGTGNRQ